MEDLRGWLARVESMGDLAVVEGADPYLEIGAVAHIARQRPRPPVVLFDSIKGYPKGFRVLTGTHTDFRRFALTSSVSPDLNVLGLIQAWRDKLRTATKVPPVVVPTAPFLKNRLVGEAVDLNVLPSPFWHEKDGGRYLGTGASLLTRDPDAGWVNLGVYRMQVHSKDSLGLYMAPIQDGRRHMEAYHARGQACPVAISIGHHPLLFLASSMAPPWPATSEYDFAGGLAGAPIEVVTCPITGIPVPSSAEIVIEGEIRPGDVLPEGPFGETTGYYASGTRPEAVIRVSAIYYRDDPILVGAPTCKPIHEHSWQTCILTSARIWNELEQAGIQGVRGVYRSVWQGGGNLIVVALKQLYAGHARQAAYVASNCAAGAYRGKFVVVVDEDIDPTNEKEVLWAVLGRCDPAEDIEIMRRAVSGPLDPIIRKDKVGFNSRAMIDACRPWEWRKEFPEVAVASPEDVAKAEARFGASLDRR